MDSSPDDLRVIEFDPDTKSGLPKWARTVVIDANGDVFVPAAMGGNNESEVAMCASYDGTKVIIHAEHVYVPAKWLAVEYPNVADLCDLVLTKIDQTHTASGNS